MSSNAGGIPYAFMGMWVGQVNWLGELRYTSGGTPVFEFGFYTRRDVTKDGETRQIHSNYKVVTWGKQAEACSKYLSKKQEVTITTTRELTAEAYPKKGTVDELVKKVVISPDAVKFGHRWIERDAVPGSDEDELPF